MHLLSGYSRHSKKIKLVHLVSICLLAKFNEQILQKQLYFDAVAHFRF